ncbi:hypothetical protein GWI33_013920 [Rhynchophorus ferrugineus]|uniref:Uncharacterized protein n=1 Tax=Rhynchophorus ferrugineus TaxID=354439 RepID=A0A834I8A5_RHYFE|nr:hypothetical protein GWI33_013920 [Rhynchophorus ferrugineus]
MSSSRAAPMPGNRPVRVNTNAHLAILPIFAHRQINHTVVYTNPTTVSPRSIFRGKMLRRRPTRIFLPLRHPAPHSSTDSSSPLLLLSVSEALPVLALF